MTSDSRFLAFGLLARRLLAAGTLVATLALSGCGGGGTTLAGGGTSGTGITQGSVTGFGSVIVNGVHFDTAGAEIFVEGVPVSEADLAVGMVVTIRGSWDDTGNGVARSVAYDDDLRGPVESVDAAAGTFVVLGRTVRVTGDTVFDAEDGAAVFNGLADMAEDQIVEVSGYFEGSGNITASRVELEDGNGEVEIKGRIANLNQTAGEFTLGGLTVSYDGGTELDDIAELSDGLFVDVRGTYDGSTLSALEIEREDDGLSGDEGEEASIEGLVANRTSAPTEFTINGQAVRVAPGAEFEGGLESDLVDGAKIEAEGALVGGVLIADEIEFRPSGDIRLEGFVADPIDSGESSLSTYLGVEVLVTQNTLVEDDRDDDPQFSAQDLAVNDFVEIRGAWDESNSRLIATRLERDDAEGDGTDGCSLRGPASEIQPSSLRILTVIVNVADPTDLDGISDGDYVEASTDSDSNCRQNQLNGAEVQPAD